MPKHCLLTVLLVVLPTLALAQVPIMDSSRSQYSNSGASGAYAGGGANSPSSAEGMLFMQLQQMQNDITQLRGQLEEQQNQLQQLKREGLERYQDLDRRLSASPSQGAGQNNAVLAAQASTQPADPAKERLYYEAAFDLIKAKDFDKASQAFNAFLNKYPNSQYAGNAQYWLGEVNLAKGDLPGAEQAFTKVGQLYPNHAKVPDSLYKLADIEQRMGNADKAHSILQQVVAQYPSSSAAQLAQRQLNR